MKSYAKVRKIEFSQTKMPNGDVDVRCTLTVDTHSGTEKVSADTTVYKDDLLTTAIRVITDQVDIAMREAREL